MFLINQIFVLCRPWFFKVAPIFLFPVVVLLANYDWIPPDTDYVGDREMWVAFAYMLGVAVWNQDRLNAATSEHRLFRPVVGIFNGFTVGLLFVLILAGDVTPAGAVIVLLFVGTIWGFFVLSKKAQNMGGVQIDEGTLRSTLIHLALAGGAFYLVVSGYISAALGAGIGFQFLTTLPIYRSMQIPASEERVRHALFALGVFFLIFAS